MKPRSDLGGLAALVLLAGLLGGLLGGLGPLPAQAAAEGSLSASVLEPLWENIGGSLSAQPLSHAVYRHWTGEDQAGAARAIRHDRADSPYQDLAILATRQRVQRGEEVPLYFAPEPYGEEQTREELEEIYEFVPIARDALVFFTSAENPVTGVSGQAMARVYAGDIVNWRDLGGKDSPIRAFQRPWSSYAQKMLENTLMGGHPMAKPQVRWVHPMEGSLEPVDVNAPYDHSPSALGYTLYTYTRGMYGGQETRILAIDGVLPSQETILNGSYPLTTPYYAVFPKAAAQGHPVRVLVAWLLTEEGQRVIRDAGLIPLTSLGEEEMVWPQPYPEGDTRQSRGTGGVRDRDIEARAYGEQSITGYKATLGYHLCWEGLSVKLPEDPVLEEEIGAWQRDAREALLLDAPVTKGPPQTVQERAFVYGNLLSLYFSIGDAADTVIRTAVFDMKTGKQLRLSDLFLDGFNYIDTINRFLLRSSFTRSTGSLGSFSIEEQNLKRPFSGLPADYPYFIVSWEGALCIAFQGMNPFLQMPDFANAFLVDMPLWHGISPWGGCAVEERYTEIDNEAKRAYCYHLSLGLDQGQSPEAEKAVNEKLEGFARRFAEMAETESMLPKPDDVVICQPFLSEHGNLHSFVYEAYRHDTLYSPVIGGFIVDLHTGEEALTPEQAKGLAAVPGATFLRKDGDAPLWAPMEPMAAYSPPEDAVVHGCWLDQYLEEAWVNVEIREAQGAWVRITVPVEAVAFWQ